ncbi:MAG: hypothetical protein ACOYJU_04335 [Anaerovoracaceae bacterium]|jgi:hypothetical protein
MKRRNVKSLSMLVALFMVISMVAAGLPLTVNATEGTPGEPDAPNASETYIVHVDYDLQGGAWKVGEKIDPYDLTANRGEGIPPSKFKGKGITPLKEGYTFKGWAFAWEDMDGKPLPTSGDIWDFDTYYIWYGEGMPDESIWTFIAVWVPVKTPKEEPTKPEPTKAEPTKAEPGKVMPKTPKTGDNSPLALATLLLVGAGAATVGISRKNLLNK